MKICHICLKIVFTHYTVTFYDNETHNEAKGSVCVDCNQKYWNGQYIVYSPIEKLNYYRDDYVEEKWIPDVKEPEEEVYIEKYYEEHLQALAEGE